MTDAKKSEPVIIKPGDDDKLPPLEIEILVAKKGNHEIVLTVFAGQKLEGTGMDRKRNTLRKDQVSWLYQPVEKKPNQ